MNGLLILAGGKGTRMKSEGPKALVPFLGTPLLEHVLKEVSRLFPKPYIVIGYKGEDIRKHLGNACHYIVQDPPLGTGHAVLCAKEELSQRKDLEHIVILPGDHPLATTRSLEALMRLHEEENALITLATAKVPSFEGEYRHFAHHGRVVRDEQGRVQSIVEAKDCTPDQLAITEVNTSYYCFKSDWLWENIGKIGNKNAAGEYYLTDMIGLTVKKTNRVFAYPLEDPFEGLGANTPEEMRMIESLAASQIRS